MSNHRSELDLLGIKSCIPECSYTNETTLSGLTRLLLFPVWEPSSTRPTDFFKNSKNYPIVVFPEQTPTKDRNLLVFDSAAFQAEDERQFQPITIEYSRPFIPFAVNHSSSVVRILAVLFSPVNVAQVTFLPIQPNIDQCRQAIASKLGAGLSRFSHEDIRKASTKVSLK